MLRQPLILLAITLAFSVAACEPDSTSENIADSIEEAGDEWADATEDMGDEIEDACEEMKEEAGAAQSNC